ncbi:MAG: hypothetical protein ICV60_14855 [Pyrinomonadaceae bacterium]|nr:hypothetical protein [Pyrinomonadaceae bacterium]
MSEKSEKRILHPRGLFMQWTGLLAGPVAWALHMQTNYALVPWVCMKGGEMLLYLVSIFAILITAAGAFAAWRAWSEGGREKEANGGGDPISRTSFMGALGLLTSAMFLLVIIAQAIPGFFFHPCQR